MTTFLILFLISLVGITFMIGRKLVLIRNGVIVHSNAFHPFIPDIKKVRSFVWRKIRIYMYAILVVLVRIYVHINILLKQNYKKIQKFIEKKIKKMSGSGELNDIQGPSNFLQKITDYKQKIRVLREKIEKENSLRRVK